MLPKAPLLLFAAVFLSGCALPGAGGGPTPYSVNYVSTAVQLTAASIESSTRQALPPTDLPTSTAPSFVQTVSPTNTPTPGPGIPLAAIQVRAPGPMSRIAAPLSVQLLAIAGESHRLEVNLFGEDARLLGRTLAAVAGEPDGDLLSVKIAFEIRAAGERGYVQASTKDARGRIQSLITVPVLLISSGTSQINPPGNTIYERIAFANLPPEMTVSGGLLQVEGQMMPQSRQPMILELITDEGRSLSLRVLSVSGTQWQPFSTSLPYKVDKPTPARLYAHQSDDVLETDAYIYSQPITLHP